MPCFLKVSIAILANHARVLDLSGAPPSPRDPTSTTFGHDCQAHFKNKHALNITAISKSGESVSEFSDEPVSPVGRVGKNDQARDAPEPQHYRGLRTNTVKAAITKTQTVAMSANSNTAARSVTGDRPQHESLVG